MSRSCACRRYDGQEVERGSPRARDPCTNASGYSRRSKVETTFHRYKAILGSAMRARGLASQRVEVRLGCKILNTMTALGIPDGEMIG